MTLKTLRKTAVCYCRVSTLQQRDADTIASQLEFCKLLVQRYDLDLLTYGNNGFVIDDGVSGSLLDGRSFSKFLDDLESGAVRPEFLVVYSLSRIARIDKSSKKLDKLKSSHAAAARIQAVLIGCGVQALDQEGPLDPSSFMFGVKLLLAAQEYKDIRRRTMDGKKSRLGKGFYARGGHPAYGYIQAGDRKEGYRLEPHPTEATYLRQLLGWYLEDGYHYAARKASQAQIPTPMNTTTERKNRAPDWTPTRWDPVSVQRIIRNVRAYLGKTEHVFDGKPYQLSWTPLIDHDLYARVQAKRNERTLKRRAQFLTTGFVDCTCGKHVRQKADRNHHRTSCAGGCGAMRQELFEDLLWTFVGCRLIQIRQHEGSRSRADEYDSEITRIKKSLEVTNMSIATLLDLRLAGLDQGAWKERNDTLNSQKALAQGQLNQVVRAKEAHASKVASEQTLEAELRNIIKEMSRDTEPAPERKREILRKLLNGGRVIVQFKPSMTITLPAFGALPAVTVDTKGEIWTQILGQEFIAGRYVSTQYAGQGQESAERALLAKLTAVGGRVISRTKMPDGSVELVKTGETYPW